MTTSRTIPITTQSEAFLHWPNTISLIALSLFLLAPATRAAPPSSGTNGSESNSDASAASASDAPPLQACGLQPTDALVAQSGIHVADHWVPLTELAQLLANKGTPIEGLCNALHMVLDKNPNAKPNPKLLDLIASATQHLAKTAHPLPDTCTNDRLLEQASTPPSNESEAASSALKGPRPNGYSTIRGRMARVDKGSGAPSLLSLHEKELVYDEEEIQAMQEAYVAAGCADDETRPTSCDEHPYTAFTNAASTPSLPQ